MEIDVTKLSVIAEHLGMDLDRLLFYITYATDKQFENFLNIEKEINHLKEKY